MINDLDLKRFPEYPDEGERDPAAMVDLLFAYVAKLNIAWPKGPSFHFDTRADLGGMVCWYVGTATDPVYGDCCDNLYTKEYVDCDEHGIQESKITDWIDSFHGFLQSIKGGLGIHSKCLNCDTYNLTWDTDGQRFWCKDCDDWAHLVEEES